MKLKVKSCRTGLSNGKPAIMFGLSGKEFDRAKSYDGKDLTGYVIEIVKPQRSDQANRYMWELIGEISDRSGVNRNDIYRQAVREAGVYQDVYVRTDDVQTYMNVWKRQGIGWFVDKDVEGDEWTSLRAYFGSSVYNSKEMSRIIDYVVEEAKTWNIETATPDELAKIKALWGK